MSRFAKCLYPLGILLLVLFVVPVFGQQNPKRLILKDGSYQSATQWQVQGSRVRYYSAERYIWEELPNDLVDWPATEKYNNERESRRDEEVRATGKELAAEEPQPPMVAPGLFLPDGGGIFLLDTYQNQPQLIELGQNSGELNKHMGRNILRAAINPLALSSKQTVELKGVRAQTQAHVTQPAVYISVDSGTPDNQKSAAQKTAAGDVSTALGSAPSMGPGARKDTSAADKQAAQQQKVAAAAQQHYGIVRMEKRKDSRVLGNVNVGITGKMSQKESWIKTNAEPAGGGWVKITPAEPLTPGEYAVVEMLEKGQINLYVWDFGVDPAAPANANAWTPRKTVTGQSDEKPELSKRPK